MGYHEDEANMAISICGMPLFEIVNWWSRFYGKYTLYAVYFLLKFLGVDAPLYVLVDSVCASQAAGEHEVSFGHDCTVK
jgi:hypothetical protein